MCLFTTDYDDIIARQNSYTSEEIINAFGLEEVEKFLQSLGVEDIEVEDDYIVCPTICHNPLDQADNMKLYYYNKTKNFHCYTECSCNFSIVSLYQRYMSVNHQDISYGEALDYLRRFVVVKEHMGPRPSYDEYAPIWQKKEDIITLPEYPNTTLDMFVPFSHPLWEEEDIPAETQKRFDIRFSYEQNKIIIPHRDINGRLVGIRSRAIDEEDLAFGKYRPAQIGQTMFNHQLGFNLYGLWEHRAAIKAFGCAIIYEGEKSVLKDDAFYGKYSVAVATCGSQLNRFQLALLFRKLFVSNITLAYDKEYDLPFSPEGKAYRQKLIEKCERYKDFANFYYIFDEKGLLDKKDAPCDKGKEVLEKLKERKIKIR